LFWNFSVFASNFFKQFKMWNAWFIAFKNREIWKI
jgi:hypothetical protein